jgi:predicted amidohydrolase YtcJ
LKPSVSVDLALVNGKIITLNARDEIAQAVAVRDGKIMSVGSTKPVLEMAG